MSISAGGEDVASGAEGDDACRGCGGTSVLVGLDGSQEVVVVGGPEVARVRSVVLGGVGGGQRQMAVGAVVWDGRSEGCGDDEFCGVGQDCGGEVEGCCRSWVFSVLRGDGCVGWRWECGQSREGDRSPRRAD
jgi:hypothetical protein